MTHMPKEHNRRLMTLHNEEELQAPLLPSTSAPDLEPWLPEQTLAQIPRKRIDSYNIPPFYIMTALILFCGALVLGIASRACAGNVQPRSTPTTSSILAQIPPELWKNWAMYSPYHAVDEYRSPPKDCKISQVNILQRHGARFPTAGSGADIVSAITNLQVAKEFKDPSFLFLKNYTFMLGASNLIPFGALQSKEAGQLAFTRYSALVSKKSLPFVRASGSERVVDSATNWTAGFSIASHNAFNPRLDVILSESLNNTLDDSMCPNAESSDPKTSVWVNTYGPSIAARLNSLAPGANTTAQNVNSLLSMCAFETLAQEKLSHFCNLFHQDEFKNFEYYGDLDKFYGFGYGNPLGPIQGVGYVNELLARLTNTPVQDNTQTNRTLDSSPSTFPFDRTIYADFSHDNEMIAIYAAIGLFPQPVVPDPTKPKSKRTWLASHLVPFGGRLVTERLTCEGTKKHRAKGQYVRMFVSDALQPLVFCDADEDSLCTLGKFVQSQSYARNDGEGDFEKCFS